MTRRPLTRVVLGLIASAALVALLVLPVRSGLPRLGTAPGFALTNEVGGETRLADLRGKVVVVNFMFTNCPSLCSVLTAELALLQEALAEEHAEDVHFVSITVDPARDSPEVLREFAKAMHYHSESWDFLTGDAATIRRIAMAYGVAYTNGAETPIRHNLLTTVIDRRGRIRVQYMGETFDPDGLLADIRDLTGGALPFL